MSFPLTLLFACLPLQTTIADVEFLPGPEAETGPVAAGPSVAGPSVAGPSDAGPSDAGPSDAGPSAGEPSQSTPGIEKERLEELVRALCTVETAGRLAGSPGFRVAADVVVGELERMGVKPGVGGGYLQSVPLVQWSVRQGIAGPVIPRMIITTTSGEELTFHCGSDFEMVLGSVGIPPQSRSWSVVVVDSPEEWPAKADPDAALVITSGIPLGDRGMMFERMGQIPEDWGIYLQLRSPRPRPERSAPKPFTTLVYEGVDPGDSLILNGAARRPFGTRTAASVRLEVEWVREEKPCFNVVGVIPGAGSLLNPDLASEVVVLMAHLDQLGTKPRGANPNNDTTYDGADNNASGVAALLEVAEALVAEPQGRTTLLLFPTGEEQGQLGVQHQLREPSLPLAKTRVAIEVFALGSPDSMLPVPGALWCTSYMDTSVGQGLQMSDLPVYMDQRPRWNYTYRSSSNRYTQAGIIGHRLSSYGSHKLLNTAKDEPRSLDFDHLTLATKTLLGAAQVLTSGEIEILRH
jgi:hypothetical protein